MPQHENAPPEPAEVPPLNNLHEIKPDMRVEVHRVTVDNGTEVERQLLVRGTVVRTPDWNALKGRSELTSAQSYFNILPDGTPSDSTITRVVFYEERVSRTNPNRTWRTEIRLDKPDPPLQ